VVQAALLLLLVTCDATVLVDAALIPNLGMYVAMFVFVGRGVALHLGMGVATLPLLCVEMVQAQHVLVLLLWVVFVVMVVAVQQVVGMCLVMGVATLPLLTEEAPYVLLLWLLLLQQRYVAAVLGMLRLHEGLSNPA
jgi:hypothetical protein